MRAMYCGSVIAESDDAIQLEGHHYFPLDSVNAGVLTRTRGKSLCFWKGVASYYDVTVDGRTARRAAWEYRHPSPLARRIKHRVAFWGDVLVTE